MPQSGSSIGIAAVLVLAVGPLLLGLVGLNRAHRTSAGEAPQSDDVGMARNYLHFSLAAKTAAALLALIAIAAAALSLRGPLLSLAENGGEISDGRTRSAFMLRAATLPALAAILLIIPYHVCLGRVADPDVGISIAA